MEVYVRILKLLNPAVCPVSPTFIFHLNTFFPALKYWFDSIHIPVSINENKLASRIL